ncbi:hypothetical protein Tco_0200499 [Tanacetum coccineum]
MALLAQSFRATLPQTNNQLRTSFNTRNQATIQDGRVVVQNVFMSYPKSDISGKHSRGNGTAGNGGAQNRAGNANAGQGKPMLLMQAQENGAVLDEEELLFLDGEQGNTFDADVDNQPVQDLALNEDNIFQADECERLLISEVDDARHAQILYSSGQICPSHHGLYISFSGIGLDAAQTYVAERSLDGLRNFSEKVYWDCSIRKCLLERGDTGTVVNGRGGERVDVASGGQGEERCTRQEAGHYEETILVECDDEEGTTRSRKDDVKAVFNWGGDVLDEYLRGS